VQPEKHFKKNNRPVLDRLFDYLSSSKPLIPGETRHHEYIAGRRPTCDQDS
jgi:hypothetical protein